MNKLFLHGKLGRDPELRYTQSQKPFATFSLATSEKSKAPNGELREQTEWHNCIAWGRQAETINQYLRKGSSVIIEGKVTYKDGEKNGVRVKYANILVFRVEFTGGRPSNTQARSDSQFGSSQQYGTMDQPPESDEFNDEDIPF